MSNQPRNHQLRRTAASLFAALVTVAFMMSAIPAAALESDVCRIEVLVGGRPLTEYPVRDTIYMEALRGREYALRLTNLIDRRIAVALAVDGLNSIDAETTSAAKASKWVLGPYETTTISGWQVSSTDARRFFFTTEEKSYGAWLDRTVNLGVIEAVVFRERAPRPTVGLWQGARAGEAPAPAEPRRRSVEGESDSDQKSAPADELAATGIGRRVDHRVRRVHLDLEERPAARLRLRYEYRQQLVHLGVLPSPKEAEALARRERASGFLEFAFAPDPFSHGR